MLPLHHQCWDPRSCARCQTTPHPHRLHGAWCSQCHSQLGWGPNRPDLTAAGHPGRGVPQGQGKGCCLLLNHHKTSRLFLEAQGEWNIDSHQSWTRSYQGTLLQDCCASKQDCMLQAPLPKHSAEDWEQDWPSVWGCLAGGCLGLGCLGLACLAVG